MQLPCMNHTPASTHVTSRKCSRRSSQFEFRVAFPEGKKTNLQFNNQATLSSPQQWPSNLVEQASSEAKACIASYPPCHRHHHSSSLPHAPIPPKHPQHHHLPQLQLLPRASRSKNLRPTRSLQFHDGRKHLGG